MQIRLVVALLVVALIAYGRLSFEERLRNLRAVQTVEMRIEAEQQLIHLGEHIRTTNRYPRNLHDPWGQPIQFERAGTLLILRSAGEDGIPFTHDDLIESVEWSVPAY